jgi:hypothetical protein
MKSFLRGITTYLLGTFLFFALFILAYFMAFSRVSANPGQVKHALAESGVYKKIPAVIYDNSVDSEATTSASIPLKSPVVRQAAIDTFNPMLVQKSTESLIDGTYGWLEGKTNTPQFTIDLKAAKDDFAESLSTRLSKLPKCSAKQQGRIHQFDPYSAECIPAGTNAIALKKEIYKQTANSDNFLKETKIDASTLKDSEGKPIFMSYSDIPTTYQAALKVPYLAALASLLLGIGLVYTSRTKRTGVEKAAKILVISGFFIVLVPIGVNHLINSLLKSSGNDKVASDIVGPVVNELSKATSKVYFITGAIYVLLAIAIFMLADKLGPETAAKKQRK